jgi:hypothetical protein
MIRDKICNPQITGSNVDDTQSGNPNKTPKMASFGITQVRGRLRGG